MPLTRSSYSSSQFPSSFNLFTASFGNVSMMPSASNLNSDVTSWSIVFSGLRPFTEKITATAISTAATIATIAIIPVFLWFCCDVGVYPGVISGLYPAAVPSALDVVINGLPQFLQNFAPSTLFSPQYLQNIPFSS